jgi:hypothetical protein
MKEFEISKRNVKMQIEQLHLVQLLQGFQEAGQVVRVRVAISKEQKVSDETDSIS